MKVLLNVSLERLEKNVNRQILVDEAIRLDDLCEGIIISFGGNLIPCYDIECDNKQYGYEELEKKYLNDFKLKKNKNMTIINYKKKKNNHLIDLKILVTMIGDCIK